MSGIGGCRGRELAVLIIDASGLIALADGAHDRHAEVEAIVESERGPFYLSPFVLQEVDYLVSERLGLLHSLSLVESVASGAYRLEALDLPALTIAARTMRRYMDMRIGLADASIVVISARHGTDRILTLDERHFRAIRPLQGGAFTILPADA